MAYELIICEKPSAANKIANALADKIPSKKYSKEKVAYYELTHKGKLIVIVSAVGHIYGLAQKEKGGRSKYPVFDIEWIPSSEVNKNSAFTKKYLNTIKRLAKGAKTFTVATDYDVEGEVIGLNIVKYACKQKDASRMKFSTLTKPDLIKSYETRQKTLDWGQAKAGETRHFMDWYFGINLSRALTASIKATGSFKLMSTGRVQGPALKLVVDKEKTINAFIPEKYWEIEFDGKVKNGNIIAKHKAGKIFEKEKADKIYNICKDEKEAKVIEVKKKKFKSLPPVPFDLTSLQIEAHKCLKISPKNTLSAAQELYSSGYISYPRTSSQQLPKEIGYKKIITSLLKQNNHKKSAEFLLNKKVLVPNNGKKADPAHPAIYPTGNVPNFKTTYDTKLYDLIVKRFFAVFGDEATRETMTVTLDCKKEKFITKGTTTVENGWFDLYGKYVMLKEEELPVINEGDICKIKKLNKLDKETTPPKRFTDASIIKHLEKENLGTKATRASIVETLKNRGFIDGKPLRATKLGIRIEETLEKYSPKIVDPELTRYFELQMKEIRTKHTGQKKVLEESKKTVTEITNIFDKHLKKVGTELKEANRETQQIRDHIGKCPKCKEGNLQIRKGKYGNFIACDGYPKCKTTFSLPAGKIESTDKLCESCNLPMIKIINARPRTICFNKECKSKNINDKELKKEIIEIKNGTVEKECPKCKKGALVLRKSIYGQFLGCNGYPKCKYTEKIIDGPLKEDFKKEKKK